MTVGNTYFDMRSAADPSYGQRFGLIVARSWNGVDDPSTPVRTATVPSTRALSDYVLIPQRIDKRGYVHAERVLRVPKGTHTATPPSFDKRTGRYVPERVHVPRSARATKKIVKRFQSGRTRLTPKRIRPYNAYTAQGRTEVHLRSYRKNDPIPFAIAGDTIPSTPIPWIINANADYKLIDKINEQMVGQTFHAGIALAEGQRSFQMIGDTAKAIAKSLREVKRGNFAGAAKALGVTPQRLKKKHKAPSWGNRRSISESETSRRWLELQYGWMPLIKDVHSAAAQLATRLEKPLQKTYSARTRVSLTYDFPPTLSTWGGTAVHEHRRTYKVLVSENPSSVAIAKNLGLLDPLGVAWEIMPWSFVIDWFIPIGSYLQARTTISSITGTHRLSDFRSTRKTVTSVPTDTSNFVQLDAGGSNYYWAVDRYPERAYFDVALPKFKPLSKALSVQHCVNAIALLVASR